MEELQWEEDNLAEYLLTIRNRIDEKFWEGQQFRLSSDHPEGQVEVRKDWLAILELTNLIYDDKIPLAVERYNNFTDRQGLLFRMLVSGALEESECPHCSEEHGEFIRDEDEIAAYLRRIKEISRNHVYQVSEDIYEEMVQDQKVMYAIRAKLEQTIHLLEEDDPRYLFAVDLLEEIYV